jgi:hypothetical protein
MEPIDLLRHPLLHCVIQGARWAGEDQFPGAVGPDLFEEWLRFITCEGEFDRFRERLQTSRSAKHRNATFAEIGSAYFLKKRCGLPIVAWEPVGAGGKEGEFLIALPDGRNMFVEVKGPEWEAEILDSEKKLGQPGPKTRPARLDQPKSVDGEAFFFAPEPSIFKAVEKAYPKLPDSMPTLLIISDDLRVSLSEMPVDALLGASFGIQMRFPPSPCRKTRSLRSRSTTASLANDPLVTDACKKLSRDRVCSQDLTLVLPSRLSVRGQANGRMNE